MSEKRYSLGEANLYYTKLIIDNETKHELGNSIVVKTLNEQQAIISRLKKENQHLRQSVEYWQKKYEEGTETFQINDYQKSQGGMLNE